MKLNSEEIAKIEHLKKRAENDSVYCRNFDSLLTQEQIIKNECYVGKNGCAYCPDIEIHYGFINENWRIGKTHKEISCKNL